MRTISAPSEHRCSVQLSAYNYPLLGMVDTGADKSYIGGRAVSKFDKPQYVHLTDQSTAQILGSLEQPI
jgi:hypothetical protein